MALEQFDAQGSCKKCGSLSPASYEYHEKGQTKSLGMGVDRQLCSTDEEHMHRKCPDCSHEWAEAPLR